MASWSSSATIANLLTLEDISNASASDDRAAYGTPVLKLLAEARSKGYDATALPLTTEKWKTRWADMCLLPSGSDREMEIAAEQKAEEWRSRPCFLKDEVTITRLDEAEGVTVMVSDWLELDATDDWVRHDAEIALQQELSYASYLNVQSAILPAPRNRDHVASYARIVNQCLKNTPFIHLSIRLPVYNPSVLQTSPPSSLLTSESIASAGSLSPSGSTPRLVISGSSSEKLSAAPESELNATWEMWDLIRSMCDYNTRLTLTLDLSPPLPTKIGVLSKWAAESVRNILLPASTFIANGKGYPVLPKTTQSFIRQCMIHYPTVILAGANAGYHSRGGESAYAQYVRHLEKTSPAVQAAERAGTVENFAQGYQDYLQAPLQPLMDNLQSVTYHTFEQDPVKYRQYEEAMYRALLEWPGEGRIVACIAGAGRGPLVARCLTAIERSRREALIYAVEKNPNAFVTLQERKEREWGDKVQLLFGDMRFIDVPEKADILVSELLGSFGDNELSPECLDGAMRFLKPDGISIPSSYTAHLAPLSSSKLFNEARAAKDFKSLETPYVVMFKAVNILSGDGGGLSGKCGPQIQECWEFEHPRRDPVLDARGLPKTNSHNARSAKLHFYIPHAGVLHGLAGYFEAVLYGNIGLSIHPHRKDQISKDMLSWFPLFFPFREPLYLPSNSELQVSIWRLTNERQVWYEWHAESFLSSPVVAQSDSGLRSSSLSGIPPSPSTTVHSPLIDADDPTFAQRTGYGTPDASPGSYETVKIGQTSLHNPGGRSSWIGL
ncbi:putative class I-like SAM-binding methyltransferase superfamily protein [Lyophyllum shimeji]|uniref:Protein arginine N-methyltransferase n=1 Tax=Lyophyllum shimeji TaxID=47721 RepID=A0A9P3PRE4_LYOSH|nr:putative class I-like SAM-binding methyltransferase superfamily protein [Lyophyllum shimeji]